MSRVIAYIDGFNLYFGLKSKAWKRYYWLDLPALCERFLLREQRLVCTHYFTSRTVQRVRSRFPHKGIVVLLPPERHSKQLQKAATGYLAIPEAKLRATQLPQQVTTASGFVLQRPGSWK